MRASPSMGRQVLAAVAAGLALAAALLSPANAQQPILKQGNAIVTGFSGTAPSAVPPASGDPMDGLFINLNGASARLLDLSAGGQPPQGQLIASPTVFQAKAGDIGQVFGIALDDGKGADGNLSGTPDLYLTAASAFGLQIVAPDASGQLKRIKTGQPAAQWMAGQWGDAVKGGTPGSIWRVNGTTGEITLFANVALGGRPNSGPGLGNIAFDAKSRQLFVSDLETGMIHRLDMHGTDLGYYDHGMQGRTSQGLAPVPYDPANPLDITQPAFSVDDAATWHYASKGRRVWGVKVLGDRLYYATIDGPQVWSLSIGADGSFGADPRLEIDVTGTPDNNAISDITFDGQGYIYLAQRGAARGDYTYRSFAEPNTSALIRYHRDPVTSKWLPSPEDYAVGFPKEYHNTNGGVALGYAHDQAGQILPGTCGRMVWSTGERLRMGSGLPGPEAVHGLQGMDRGLVRPANQPPVQAYFADYDGEFNDPDVNGHMGDVEIWQPCQGSIGLFEPPYVTPPSGTFNLTLTKIADPKDCVMGGLGYQCHYRIFLTNTGSLIYAGPLTVEDWLPAAPAGAAMTFSPAPPWFCNAYAPTAFECINPNVVLFPGQSTEIDVTVDLPSSYDECYLDNVAEIEWWPGYGDANPADDASIATAHIPNAHCLPPTGKKTNLRLQKFAKPICNQIGSGDWLCKYVVVVTNTGPGTYNDKIEINDTLPSGASASFFGPWPWACAGGPPTYHCVLPPVSLNPGQSVALGVLVHVPAPNLKPNLCDVPNKAQITYAPGGSDANTNPGDDAATATAHIPSEQCIGKKTDLKIEKKVIGCAKIQAQGGGWACAYNVTVTNVGPGAYSGNIVVNDTLSAAPSAMVTSPAGLCTGAGPGYTCTIPGAALSPGQSTGFQIGVLIPQNTVIGAKCQLRNDVKITSAPGGSPMNFDPSNDTASATAAIPDPQCNSVPPPPTHDGHVKIEKTCKPSAAGGGIHCRITVTNDGGQPISTPVTFGDQGQWTGNGTPLQVASATPDSPAVTCSGLPSALTCTLPGSALPPGSSHWVDVTIAAAPGQTTYHNCAAIMAQGDTTYVAAGTPSCVDGGSEISVIKTAPATCTYGQDCVFQVTITNNGDSAFMGSLQLGDQMFLGAGAASGAAITSISPALGCATEPTSLPFTCTATVSLGAHESRTHTISVHMPAAPAGIVAAGGGLNCFVAADASSAEGGASPAVLAQAKPKSAGNGPGYSCAAFKLLTLQLLKTETCPGDLMRIGTQCKCPDGKTLGANYRCHGGGTTIIPIPLTTPTPSRPQTCQAPLIGTYPNCHCPSNKPNFVNGRCVADQQPAPTCQQPRFGTYPNCVCPADRPFWTGSDCVRPHVILCKQPLVQRADGSCGCPNGGKLVHNECVTGGGNTQGGDNPPKCKGILINGVCLGTIPGTVKQSCPAPARGNLPNCVCPRRMTWNGSLCTGGIKTIPNLQQLLPNLQLQQLPKRDPGTTIKKPLGVAPNLQLLVPPKPPAIN